MIIHETMKKERKRADARRIKHKKLVMLRRKTIESFYERGKSIYRIKPRTICDDCPHKLKPSCQTTRAANNTWQCTKQREATK